MQQNYSHSLLVVPCGRGRRRLVFHSSTSNSLIELGDRVLNEPTAETAQGGAGESWGGISYMGKETKQTNKTNNETNKTKQPKPNTHPAKKTN